MLPAISNGHLHSHTSKAHPPALMSPSGIKQEFPPFRPPLPHTIDEDISIEKEVEPKKLQKSTSGNAPVDVDDVTSTDILPFLPFSLEKRKEREKLIGINVINVQ